MGNCEKCDGVGYIYIILKARSVGITTWGPQTGDKIPCPKCGGEKPWWMKERND